MNFDKDAFAEILNKAKGNMSINEYARKSSVSAAHISRFLRSMIDVPPIPLTIKKLATYAQNGIKYEDMMKAVGHLDTSVSLGEKVNNSHIEQLLDMAVYFIDVTNLSYEELLNLQSKTFEVAYSITTKIKNK